MKNILARFAALLVLATCMLLFGILPAWALDIGFFVLEPHAMLEGKKPSGAAIEYFRDYIAPEMGVKVRFTGPVPFARLLHDFEDGNYDAILLLAKNPDRARQFRYPQEPFVFMQSGLLVNKGFKYDNLSSSAELSGMSIGYTGKAWRAPFMRDPSLTYEMVAAESATRINFRKFNDGRIDAVYNPDKTALLYRIKRIKNLRPYKILSIPGPAVGLYTVFHPSVAPSLIENYENALRKVRRKFPYAVVVNRYLDHQ